MDSVDTLHCKTTDSHGVILYIVIVIINES